MAKNFTLAEHQYEKDKERLKKLKRTLYENYTYLDIMFLTRKGVINGVGPENYGPVIRWICTKLFKHLDYKRHDVNFWKNGDIEKFHKANWGILKYSEISILEEYVEICKSGWKKIYKLPKYWITKDFKSWISHKAYNACESAAGLKAWNAAGKIA